MVELHPAQCNQKDAMEEFYKFILDDSRVFGMTVTDRWDKSSFENSLALAKEARLQTGKPVLAVVAGKNRSFEDVSQAMAAYRQAGIQDFLAVTGNYVDDSRDGARNDYPGKYTDAVDIIRLARRGGQQKSAGDANQEGAGGEQMVAGGTVGAVVNPFRYLQDELFGQYSKLIRKLNNGAAFVVAQSGWDMKKYQELLWFLRSRELFIPLIARMLILERPEEKLTSNLLYPGIQLPLSLVSQLERETELDDEAFFNAQAQRTAFMAAGCQLMGYSGIQVAGIRNVRELETFLDLLDCMQAQYSSYQDWAKAWNKRYEGVNLVPYASLFSTQTPFYLYNPLLDSRFAQFGSGIVVPSEIKIPLPAIADRVQSKLTDPETPAWLKKTVTRWTGNDQSDRDALTHALGLDNSSCPKRLTQGPCGGAKADGQCEACEAPCFFQRVTRLAAWSNQFAYLEDSIQK